MRETTHRLHKVVVKNEIYITHISGAYEATPEEDPTLSLNSDFLSYFRILLGT